MSMQLGFILIPLPRVARYGVGWRLNEVRQWRPAMQMVDADAQAGGWGRGHVKRRNRVRGEMVWNEL